MRVERAKMCRATWESLKAHIIRERKRKKDEMEADAEEKRQKQKREQLKNQHKSTLQETIAEIQQSETRLQELKEEKHEMFLKLKKVLNEDETRRRQQLLKDAAAAQQQLQSQTPPASGQQPMTHHQQPLLSAASSSYHQQLQQQHLHQLHQQQAGSRLTLHKQQHPHHQQQHHPTLLQMSGKRARSPSPQPIPVPPPQQAYRHEYLYKGQPMPAMSFAAHSNSVHASSRDDKHHPVYMPPNRGYALASHSGMDPTGRVADKAEYYGAPHRPNQPPHMSLHPGAMINQAGGKPPGHGGPGVRPPTGGPPPGVPSSSGPPVGSIAAPPAHSQAGGRQQAAPRFYSAVDETYQ